MGDTYSNEETGYYYLRVDNLSRNGDVTGEAKWLAEGTYKALERYRIFTGDLLISIAGTIGRVAVFDEVATNGPTILTENCAKIHLSGDVLPEYMMLLLLSDPLQRQMGRDYIQTTIPKLGLDRIRQLRLPSIPSLEIQGSIVSEWRMEVGRFKSLLKMATDLLASIDDYLLSELGITLPPEPENTIANRIFTAQRKDLAGWRFDPHWLLNVHRFMGDGRYSNSSVSEVAYVEKGKALTSSEIKEGQYPVIAGGQSSPYSHNEFNYSGNVITVSASGAYAGYVWFHESPIFASDCSVVYSRNSDKVLTKYIYEILRLKQRELYLLQTGAGQPHVYVRDISKMRIPIPEVEIQRKLVDHISAVRKQVADSWQGAVEELDAAKRRIEAMLLGDAAV